MCKSHSAFRVDILYVSTVQPRIERWRKPFSRHDDLLKVPKEPTSPCSPIDILCTARHVPLSIHSVYPYSWGLYSPQSVTIIIRYLIASKHCETTKLRKRSCLAIWTKRFDCCLFAQEKTLMADRFGLNDVIHPVNQPERRKIKEEFLFSYKTCTSLE